MKVAKKPGLLGLRDIGTVRTVVQKQQKQERSFMVGRFARLDAERERLEREIAMWSSRQADAKLKLLAVIEQINTITPLLLDPLQPTKPRRVGGKAALNDQLGEASAKPISMLLNY